MNPFADELDKLNREATNFEVTVIRDSIQRLRYQSLVTELRNGLIESVKKGTMSAAEAVKVSYETRNSIRIAQQGKLTEFGFELSGMLEKHRSFAALLEKRAQERFSKNFLSLSSFEQRSAVYIDLIEKNVPNARVTRGAIVSSTLSLALIVLSGALIFEEVVKSDHKLQTALREITLLGWTVMGGVVGQRVGTVLCLAPGVESGPAAPWIYAGCTLATSTAGGALGRAIGELSIWVTTR